MILTSNKRQKHWPTSSTNSSLIKAVLGREDNGLIPYNCDWEGLEPLDVRTNPEPD
jgi:hypothetical protein